MTTASRSVVYRLIADIGQFQARMAQAGASTKKVANDMTSATKEGEKFRKGFDDVGRTAGRVGLVAAASLGIMVARAAGFEQAMSNVAAATHETEENMDSLRNAAIEAGASTAFSASEAAGAIENLAKAGVSTADILGGALKGSLDLAAAGQLPVAEAAEIAATALTQFQLEGSEAAHVADLLAAGAGKAQGEVSDMGNALKFAGVPAANLGVSIEETAGAIALFAKNGIVGEQAGTSLRGMLSSLTSPSKIAQTTLDDLSISLFDAQGEFIGLAGVAEQLQTRLGGLTEQERANALGRIFGNEQLQAANVLYREGAKGVQDWTREVDDAGFAAETAAIKTDNLRGDIERLGGALDTALISGGSGSQGALRTLTQSLTGVVDTFNDLPPSAQNAATGLLAAGAVAGGTIWAGSKLITGIANTRQALADMGPAGRTAGRGLAVATKAVGGLTLGIIAYNEATKFFNIGIKDEDIRRTVELMEARSGPDLQARIRATTEAIKEQQAISDSEFGVNIGVAKLFPFDVDSSAADAQDKVDGLQKHLEELRHEQDLWAVSAEQATDVVPFFGDVLGKVAPEIDKTAAAHKNMAVTVVEGGKAIRYTAEQIEEAKEDYAEARKQAAEVGGAFFDISEKVDKASVSLGAWLRELEKQTVALENFTANAQKAAKNGLDEGLIQSLEDLGPAGALRMEQLANATDAEIDRANKAWKRGQKAIDDYVKATTKVPKPLRIEVDTNGANTALESLLRSLRQLRGAHVDVRLGPIRAATGGHIRGPGSATSDSIPAYLSNGEYVIKAAAVARYGVAMFDRLNAMHFAQGGFVGGGSQAPLDTGALVAALAQMRPLANQINMQPHDYGAVAREFAQLSAAGSMDGGRM